MKDHVVLVLDLLADFTLQLRANLGGRSRRGPGEG